MVRCLRLSPKASRSVGSRDHDPRSSYETRPGFGYADGFDETAATYTGPIVAKSPPIIFAPASVIVRAEVAFRHTNKTGASPAEVKDGGLITGPATPDKPAMPKQPRRFYGSVEIDMVRPVKAFD